MHLSRFSSCLQVMLTSTMWEFIKRKTSYQNYIAPVSSENWISVAKHRQKSVQSTLHRSSKDHRKQLQGKSIVSQHSHHVISLCSKQYTGLMHTVRTMHRINAQTMQRYTAHVWQCTLSIHRYNPKMYTVHTDRQCTDIMQCPTTQISCTVSNKAHYPKVYVIRQ